MKKYWYSYLLVLLLLYSCGGESSKEKTAESSVLSVAEFAEIISDENVMLIDVRTPGEYENGFIEGAVNIDIKAGDFESKIKHFDKETPIAVYCAKGGRSASAAAAFKKLGFKMIYDLEGGYTAWSSESVQ